MIPQQLNAKVVDLKLNREDLARKQGLSDAQLKKLKPLPQRYETFVDPNQAAIVDISLSEPGNFFRVIFPQSDLELTGDVEWPWVAFQMEYQETPKISKMVTQAAEILKSEGVKVKGLRSGGFL